MMKRNVQLLILIVVVISISAVFLFIVPTLYTEPDTNPLPLCPMDGRKVSIASPSITSFNGGDSDTYYLCIKNDNVEKNQTYHLDVYLEDVGGGLNNENIKEYK